ncbi:alpha-endosulfine-like [Balaenoptera musculus]|uniref:Alpha-endosulfine n=1 Tax=Balaenoptera musculus TaxID=9771 RepID=A0A8B8Z116_BALMU|nr:alpha-endosulfine-like [Balaenoptera musculus]
MSQKQEEENPVEETGKEKQDTQEKEGTLPERAEEAKLKARYPSLGQKLGGSDFLMKRLQKGQKYFDSGDYNMPKAKMKNKQLPSTGPDKNLVTGDHIPTPQVLPQRKSSLITSKLASVKYIVSMAKKGHFKIQIQSALIKPRLLLSKQHVCCPALTSVQLPPHRCAPPSVSAAAGGSGLASETKPS